MQHTTLHTTAAAVVTAAYTIAAEGRRPSGVDARIRELAHLMRAQQADDVSFIQPQVWVGRCPGQEGFDLPAQAAPSHIEALDEGDPESTVLPNLERYPGGELDRIWGD